MDKLYAPVDMKSTKQEILNLNKELKTDLDAEVKFTAELNEKNLNLTEQLDSLKIENANTKYALQDLIRRQESKIEVLQDTIIKLSYEVK